MVHSGEGNSSGYREKKIDERRKGYIPWDFL